MHKWKSFNTLELTVGADQLADTKSLIHYIMRKNMDGNNHLDEMFVYLSNKVKCLWTNSVLTAMGLFPPDQ